MSLLNKASLIQIPSGYKDGTLYSAKPTNGDGDFTFSRGSNLSATRTNSEGLIEKGRENLLLQSNTFDTTWSLTTGINLTSGQADKDGGTTAWLLKRVDGSSRFIKQTISQSDVQSFSVYLKAEATEWVYLFLGGTTSWAYFDLGSGSVGLTNSLIDSSIEAAGNGFYRCTITASATTSEVRIYPAQGNGAVSGDSDNGVYIQDAQLEVGLVSTDVITTTTTTEQAGILEDMPRLDYSGGASCPSLLLEPQRSNLITQSEYGGDYLYVNTSHVQNTQVSPEGVINSITIESDTTNSSHYFGSNFHYFTSGTTYTSSVFIKKGTGRYFQLTYGFSSFGADQYANYDLQDGVVTYEAASATASIEDFGNGWYRCVLTATATSNFNDRFYAVFITSGTASRVPSHSSSLNYYFYGFQMEEGSYATSYIPTYGGSSVTRSADAASDSNVTPTSNKATLYIEINGNDDSENRSVCGFRNGTTNQYGLYFWGADNNKFGFNTWAGDSYGITNSTIFNGDLHKIAAVFDFTDFTQNALFIDGVKQSISQVRGTTVQRTANKVSLIAPNPNENPIQDVHKFISFDSALTDAECEQLTTI